MSPCIIRKIENLYMKRPGGSIWKTALPYCARIFIQALIYGIVSYKKEYTGPYSFDYYKHLWGLLHILSVGRGNRRRCI